MKFAAIIAEFNPLTNGHEYIIKKVQELLPNHKILIIMSGSFVQRGELAIIDKFTRAKHATMAGADVVIELPSAYASSSAEDFAYGAVKTLSAIPSVTHLVFGSECGDIEKLKAVASKLSSAQDSLDVKKSLKTGNSYAKSVIDIVGDDILSKPNNMLAVSYLKALKETNSTITPLTIKREDNYNSTIASPLASATAIRASVKNKTINQKQGIVPDFTFDDLISAPEINLERLYSLIRYKILTTSQAELKSIYGISEGLEYKIKEEIVLQTTYDDFISALTSKRYPSSKIKRILTHLLLDLTCDKMNLIKNSIPYIKLLAINNENKREILKTLNGSSATLLTKKKDYEKLDSNQLISAELDLQSTNVHSIITNKELNKDFKVKI